MSAKRILVIDDEACLSAVIQTCLRKLGGWTVLLAESGKEGLLKAQTEQPDAILLDVMMPDLDGLTVLRLLKSDASTQAIPVILLTAKKPSNASSSYASLDIVGILDKPFDPLKLSEQVAHMLNWTIGTAP